MTNHFNFMTQWLKSLLYPSWIIWQKTALKINHNIDLNSLTNFLWNQIIQWNLFLSSFEKKLRRYHPSCHINWFFGFWYRFWQRLKILLPINIKIRINKFSGRSKTVKPVNIKIRWFLCLFSQQIKEHNIILNTLCL